MHPSRVPARASLGQQLTRTGRPDQRVEHLEYRTAVRRRRPLDATNPPSGAITANSNERNSVVRTSLES